MLLLEFGIGPPMHAAAIEVDGLGKYLIVILAQCVEVNIAALDRPKTPVAGFVLQIERLVRGADEHALPWLMHFFPSPWRAIALGIADKEFFEVIDCRAAVGAKLRDFDQPFSPQVLKRFLAGDVRQLIAEILTSQDAARGG